jgi:hypothetical protein
MHGYKNLLKTLDRVISDIGMLQARGDQAQQIGGLTNELKSVYQDIESAHRPLIDGISSKASKWVG